MHLKYLEKLAIATNYLSKDDVLQLQNTSVIYLLIENMSSTNLSIDRALHIEHGAFSSWKVLKSLELKSDINLEIHSNAIFTSLSSLHVTHLYVDGGLSYTIHLQSFEAPNLKALAVKNTNVYHFNFLSSGTPTVEWLDISRNKIITLDSFRASFPNLYYLSISDQTSDCVFTALDYNISDKTSIDCASFYSDTCHKILPNSLISDDFSGTQLCYSQLAWFLTSNLSIYATRV